MFIVNLTYIKDLEQVEKYLEQHIQFLDTFYQWGHFIASGRKVPRTGGIILLKAETLQEVSEIISQDPFKIHGIADYDIIEFVPSKFSEAFSQLIN
ncbi:YciI family protein [Streptococcus dentiloxodontae]